MISKARYKSRVAKVREIMHRHKVDAILLTNPISVRYCSGFTGEDSYLLILPRSIILLTDGRFTEQARLSTHGVKIVVRRGEMIATVANVLKRRKIHNIGIEADNLTVVANKRLNSAIKPIRIKPLEDVVKRLRQIKDEDEVSSIRASIRVAEGAFRALIAGGAKKFIGKTEQQIAADLEYLMRQAGAEKIAFDTIVARGPHSSLPHYKPGGAGGFGRAAKIRPGDTVLIDWGAIVKGYCSDLTRMVFIGKIPPRIGRIYEIVLSAQSAAVEALRAGATCGFVDAAAREVISGAGFAESFTHGLGHGIGMEVHEAPYLGRRNDRRIEAGMVVTVEPGIYLPRRGGVRIEDDFVITGTGPKRLTTLTRRADEMILV